MARARDNRRFLREHKFCCLCGGLIPSKTIEHAPPRALFMERDVKGAFRFPACNNCNSRSSSADQCAALAVLIMGAATASHVTESYLEKLMIGVGNNEPDFIRCFRDITGQKQIRINGLIRSVDLVEVDRAAYDRWLNPWAAKQAAAFWYKEMGKILPPESGIFVHWIPNARHQEHSEFFSHVVAKFGLKWTTPKQGKIEYPNQFFYGFNATEDGTAGTMLFNYHDSAALWCGVFEDRDQAMRANSLPIYTIVSGLGPVAFSYPLELPT